MLRKEGLVNDQQRLAPQKGRSTSSVDLSTEPLAISGPSTARPAASRGSGRRLTLQRLVILGSALDQRPVGLAKLTPEISDEPLRIV